MKRNVFWFLGAALVLILFIPEPETKLPELPPAQAFEWKSDSLWKKLEVDFLKARQIPQDSLSQYCSIKINQLNTLLDSFVLDKREFFLFEALSKQFETASVIAASKNHTQDFINFSSRFRGLVKEWSKKQNNDSLTKIAVYKFLYGNRAALEEVLKQQIVSDSTPVIIAVKKNSSSTPFFTFSGIEIHSGDMLVSRGGAAASALIARGNDFPGNFSHVAFMYVDEKTKQAQAIEAHIEVGVKASTFEEYLKDKKLRILVLEPNIELEAYKKDPMLPHKAAAYALNKCNASHIPYDFTMNYLNRDNLFCSEVVYDAYEKYGCMLWKYKSTISQQGAANWLSQFGVKTFVSLEPSDLEYDPQLDIVAEYIDIAMLKKDHIDNAILDALLEAGNNGRKPDYKYYQLPFARILKAYCWIQNRLGVAGKIPEGMSATSALKNELFFANHDVYRKLLTVETDSFISQNKYYPPYWQQLEMAREIINTK